jgi:uncharacterized membrane protein
MSIDNWLKSAKPLLNQIRYANKNAEKFNQIISGLMLQISNDVSKQWLSTHNTAINQIENDMKHNGNLITEKKNVNRELELLGQAIADTKRKLGTCQYLNEFNLTKLEGLSPHQDFTTDRARLEYALKKNFTNLCIQLNILNNSSFF